MISKFAVAFTMMVIALALGQEPPKVKEDAKAKEAPRVKTDAKAKEAPRVKTDAKAKAKAKETPKEKAKPKGSQQPISIRWQINEVPPGAVSGTAILSISTPEVVSPFSKGGGLVEVRASIWTEKGQEIWTAKLDEFILDPDLEPQERTYTITRHELPPGDYFVVFGVYDPFVDKDLHEVDGVPVVRQLHSMRMGEVLVRHKVK